MKHLLLSVGLLAAVPAVPAVADTPKAVSGPDVGARLVPTFGDDNKPIGLKVFAIVKGGRFDQAHFEAGDLIVAIDGDAVTTPKGEAALHDNVIGGRADAVIEVRRKGATVTLTSRAKH